jgi:hypothetical protein
MFALREITKDEYPSVGLYNLGMVECFHLLISREHAPVLSSDSEQPLLVGSILLEMIIVGLYIKAHFAKFRSQLLCTKGSVNEEGWTLRQLRRNI